MSNPLVSVIMPVYNGERYISEAIESVLSQTYQNLELIIVNDGSTDNSKTAIESYLQDPRIRYFEQPNAGVAAARNTAIKESQGKLIGFLDQDDFWYINKLKIQIEYLERHKNISLVYSDYEVIDEINNKIENASDKADYDLSKCDFVSLFIKNKIGILTVLTYKRCILSSGQFNQNLKGTDDYELWMKIALQYKLAYQPEVLAAYRSHGYNTSNDKLKMLIFESMALDNIIKNYPCSTKLLSRTIIRNRLFVIYKKIANFSLYMNRDRKNARYYYITSLKHNPLSLEVINNIFSTLIPLRISRFINWQYRKLIKFAYRNKQLQK